MRKSSPLLSSCESGPEKLLQKSTKITKTQRKGPVQKILVPFVAFCSIPDSCDSRGTSAAETLVAFVAFCEIQSGNILQKIAKITKISCVIRAKSNPIRLYNETLSSSLGSARFAPGKVIREMPFFSTASWKFTSNPMGISSSFM